ncbi:cyclophane-forming radical SAM/SPASM peptide maturase YhhB [Methylomonas sp. MO1]|uniref:cyclophane-forming radical SAM/SPASM peptide maturase YhhB n=1 Tax=Methylomonas sp. MO1 TaxID=3073619 RepID=UPI0028A4C9E7|nr:cyclophane-forming radical SAM/SPASM peptide maturase YhhB [Methylomonas sp. MO1]MDT4292352.1 cyclophane-forming radical SAM/SPASM peptide maturase YhhB [Methylomonas sp. MO1]
MVEIDTILIKVASQCNINCSYCYVYNMGDDSWANMPNFISQETVEAITKELEALKTTQKRPFAIVLHGGEPLLLGVRRLELLLHSLRKTIPDNYCISIQTNGMLISDKILDLCSRYKTSISISLDGPVSIHDNHRLGHKGEGTYHRVIEGIEKLKAHPDASFLFAGLLAVIDPTSNPHTIYRFFKDIGTPNVDFLYRDGNHAKLPFGKETFQSTEYGTWLAGLLDIYLADQSPIKIRILDDIIRLALGGLGLKEGVGVTDFGIAVIDTDGSVTKNDTLKSSYKGADRFLEHWNIHTHRLVDIFASDEFAHAHALQRPSSLICQACPELRICGGGMPLHRWKSDSEYDNPSVYCNDQLLIINKVKAILLEAKQCA